MRFFFCLLIGFFFSPALAVTLGEIGAAQGIANTLRQTAQPQYKGLVNQAKETVQNYEAVQQNQMKAISSAVGDPLNDGQPRLEPPVSVPSAALFDEARISKDKLETLTSEELSQRLQDHGIAQDVNPVDYKKPMQIFYKRECSGSQENCQKTPVLTNIKSVIFDYARSRGSFAQSK